LGGEAARARGNDRGFSETDLRATMEVATGFRDDIEPGRWVVETRHESRSWLVVVEPDSIDKLLVVITGFQVDGS
jgi:hypothetical protein